MRISSTSSTIISPSSPQGRQAGQQRRPAAIEREGAERDIECADRERIGEQPVVEAAIDPVARQQREPEPRTPAPQGDERAGCRATRRARAPADRAGRRRDAARPRSPPSARQLQAQSAMKATTSAPSERSRKATARAPMATSIAPPGQSAGRWYIWPISATPAAKTSTPQVAAASAPAGEPRLSSLAAMAERGDDADRGSCRASPAAASPPSSPRRRRRRWRRSAGRRTGRAAPAAEAAFAGERLADGRPRCRRRPVPRPPSGSDRLRAACDRTPSAWAAIWHAASVIASVATQSSGRRHRGWIASLRSQ